MSREARDWARAQGKGLSNAAKLVLRELAEYHNIKRGLAWPSQHQLSEGTMLPLRTVEWSISALVKASLITIAQKGNQHQPTHYRLCLPEEHPQESTGAEKGAPARMSMSTRKNEHEHPQKQVRAPASPEANSLSGTSHGTVIEPLGTIRTTRGQEKKRETVVDEPFILRMVEKYQSRFTAEETKWHIQQAMNHKARLKRFDLQMYVDGWLRRESGRNGTAPHATVPSQSVPQPSSRPELF